jgi:fibronectin-binding autotransporter adhesin
MKHLVHNSVRFLSASLGLLILLVAFSASASLYYWDPNGTSTPGSGTWDTTSAKWATSSTLTASTVPWSTANAAYFVAGTAKLGTITVTVSGNITNAGIFNGGVGTAPGVTNLTLSGSGSLYLPSTVQAACLTSNTYSTVISVPITGPGSLVPENSGQCYLNAANTYSGGTSLGFSSVTWSGIVNFNNANAFGTGPIKVIRGWASSKGALVVEGSTAINITNTFDWSGSLSNPPHLNIVGNTAGLTFSGPWTLGGKAVNVGSGGTGLIIISGVISGTTGNSFTKFNPGTLQLTATNTYSGTTTNNDGILQLGDGISRNGTVAGTIVNNSANDVVWANPTALTYSKVISGSGGVTYNGPGVLTLGAASTYSNATTIATAATVKYGVANALPSGTSRGDVSLAGAIDLSGFSGAINGLNGAGTVDNSTGVGTYTLTVGNDNADGVFTGLIKNTSGTVALTKTGSGTLTLSGANTYSGLTTVNGGTLQLDADNTLPAASSVVVNSAGTLNLNGKTDTIAALSGSGLVGNLTTTLTVNGDSAIVTTQNFSGYSCIAGQVNGFGTLLKGGTHAMAIRSDLSAFGGFFTLSGGTLSVGAAPNRLPASLALNVPTGATFQLDANNQTVSALTGSGSVNLGGGILTVNQDSTGTFNGVIQNSELAGSSTALGHGLRGYYYDNIDMTNLKAVRDDATVNFADLTVTNNTTGLPDAGLDINNVSARWLGKVRTIAAGTYTFSTTCDDGRRLWVNGQLVVDSWVGGANTKSGTIDLAANTLYDIVLEWFNGTGGSKAQLLWMPPGDVTAVIIPTEYLLLPGAGTLVKGGSGSLTLAGASTYSGNTVVSSGTLIASVGSALGNGNVTVADSATLTLGSSTAVAAGVDLIVGAGAAAVNLSYTGTDNIRALSLDGGSTYQVPGTYGSLASSAAHKFAVFTGSGILNVTGNASSTALVSSPTTTAVYGSTVTLTATVSGAGGIPTGTVTFYDGANLLGTSSLVSGIASFSVNNLSVAYSHSLTAVYNGDSTHTGSTSGAAGLTTTVATLVPTVVIANKIYDATTTATIASLAGMLASDSNYVHVATGYTATFADKDVANGKAVTITGMTLAGSLATSYTLSTATTNSTANITPKGLSVTGITANDRVYDTTTAATINVGAAALLTAEAPGVGTTADGKPYTGDTVTLVTGSAVGTFADANVGTAKIVTISGLTLTDAQAFDYSVNTTTATNKINKASTQDALTSSPNPSSAGGSVTFTATLSAVSPGAGIPTGNVTFYAANVPFSTNAMVSGVASASNASLPVGTTPIEARYTGDTNFVGVTNSLPQVVNAASTSPTTISNIIGTTLTYGGGGGAQFVLLGTNDVSAPLANWARIATNGTTPGTFTVPAVGSAAPKFYRIKSE